MERAQTTTNFAVEFFIFVFPSIAHVILKSINHSYAIQEMPDSDKLGIITCLPKPG